MDVLGIISDPFIDGEWSGQSTQGRILYRPMVGRCIPGMPTSDNAFVIVERARPE